MEPGVKVQDWILVVHCGKDKLQKVVALPKYVLEAATRDVLQNL